MSEYIIRCTLDVDGQSVTDFKAVTIKETELHKPVNLMHKTGFAGVTPRHGVTVDYVVPQTDPEFPWEGVKDGRLTVEFENGRKKTFTGVYILKVGDMKVDGENETVRSIELGATSMIVE